MVWWLRQSQFHAELVKILVLMLHQTERAVAYGLILVPVEGQNLIKKIQHFVSVLEEKNSVLTDRQLLCMSFPNLVCYDFVIRSCMHIRNRRKTTA